MEYLKSFLVLFLLLLQGFKRLGQWLFLFGYVYFVRPLLRLKNSMTSLRGLFPQYKISLRIESASPMFQPLVFPMLVIFRISGIICLGLFLSDLTFIEEGNPDKFENGYINFSKCRWSYASSDQPLLGWWQR